MRVATISATVLLAAGVAASAQTETAGGGGRFGTTVSMQAGFTSGSMDEWGGALGATLLQELGSRWALEASAAYYGESMAADSLSLNANILYHLRPTHERASPYLAVGGGLYHTSFDRGDPRLYQDAHAMHRRGGAMRDMGMVGEMYGRGDDGDAGGHNRSFTDPAISAGAGIRINLGSKMFLRPDGRVLVVMSGGDSLTVGVLAVNFGWRF